MFSRSVVPIAWHPLAMARLAIAAAAVLLAVGFGAQAGPAGAIGLDNNGVTTVLEAEGDSGVSGTASIAVQPGGAGETVLTLDVGGLTPGASYSAHIHAGTPAAPSASFGLIGPLEPDASGRVQLLTTIMVASSSGSAVELSLELLADGNHFIEIHAPDGAVVASGEIPFAAPSSYTQPGTLIEIALDAAAESGASGTATITSKERGPAWVALELEGLPAGAEYLVRLHAGGCELPSASFGTLGTLVAGEDGSARLLSTSAEMSAGGAAVDLSMELLADGDHVIRVVDATTLVPVACAAIPQTETPAAPGLLFVPLAPEGDAGVSASANIQVQDDGAGLTMLRLEAADLPPGASYVAHVHAGTPANPSASFGMLGTLVADEQGRGTLQTTTMAASGTGAEVELSLELLADGDHFIELHGPDQGVAASGQIPFRAPTGGEGEIAPTGIEAVDAVISATLRGDAAALAGLVRLSEIACGPESPEGFALVPTCEEGEVEGTLVQVLPAAACEGYWARDPMPVLETFAQHGWRLHAVVRGPETLPSDSLWPAADYLAIFSPRPGSFVDGLAAYIQGGDLVAVLAGCPSPEALMHGPNGEPLPVVFMPGTAAGAPISGPGGDLVAQVVDRGGLCLAGQVCQTETNIYADGTIVRRSGDGAETVVQAGAERAQELQAQIAAADFANLRSRPFSGVCPIAYDGTERVYRFATTTGIEELPGCTFDIDPGAEPVQLTDALVEQAAQEAGAAEG